MVQIDLKIKSVRKNLLMNIDSESKEIEVGDLLQEIRKELSLNDDSEDTLSYRGIPLDVDTTIEEANIGNNYHLLYLFHDTEEEPVIHKTEPSTMIQNEEEEPVVPVNIDLEVLLEGITRHSQINQLIEFYMNMGFSRNRVFRGLLLNRFDQESTLEWLLSNVDDPSLDEPLNINDVDLLHPRSASVDEAIEQNICTYSVTGDDYAVQNWYNCYTCGLVDGEGCCEVCVNTCHRGHKVSEVQRSSSFFCDCGASGKCQSLSRDDHDHSEESQ